VRWRRGRVVIAAATLLCATGAAGGRSGKDNPWARQKSPSRGGSEAIGGYSDGCLAGGLDLPGHGTGFRVMLPERRRHFGHRVLIELIRALGAEVDAKKLGFLPLGDLSQPRGGPAPDGHSSHQTGLDVDIWFAPAPAKSGKPPEPISVVDGKAQALGPAWRPEMAEVLELAAADERVARIFVHPVIKRELCQRAIDSGSAPPAWLRKIRPWWGHDDHFHVRLACPAGDKDCRDQEPIAAGDGCAELTGWFAPPDAKKVAEHKAYQSHVGAVPTLPERCSSLLR
jgi:penicillin-insensitive murein DD-endopeptidase